MVRSSPGRRALATAVATAFLVAGVLAVALSAVAISNPKDEQQRLPIDEVVRGQEVEEPPQSVPDSLAEADLIVMGTVDEIADPRWNSRDGTDWRDEFEASEGNLFTAPLVYSEVTITIVDVLAKGEGPVPLSGDKLAVDFPLDPSVDLLAPEEMVGLSVGVRARFLDRGDTRVFLLRWLPFPYSDGWGEDRWRGSVANGTWGVDPDAQLVYPAGRHQADELRGVISG